MFIDQNFIPLLAVLSWCGEKGNLCTVGRNVSWFSNYGKQDGGFPEFPYDLAIPLLGIYPNKTSKATCTPIAPLYTIGETLKHPKCPPTDEWIKM